MEMTNEQHTDQYQKAQLEDGSLHMLWTEDGEQRQMLCGRSRENARLTGLLRKVVDCQRCRGRAFAIVAGTDDPRNAS